MGNREVKLENKTAYLVEVDSISFAQVELLHSSLNIKSKVGKFDVSMISATIKVGCQEFTKEDIELVSKAIQQFK